jgi:hypothetical protein
MLGSPPSFPNSVWESTWAAKKRSFPVIYVPKQSLGTSSGVWAREVEWNLGMMEGQSLGHSGLQLNDILKEVTGFLHRPLQRDVGKGQG